MARLGAFGPPRFVYNPGVVPQIEKGNPLIEAQLHSIDENIADEARDIAPVDTGDYRDSIKAVRGGVVAESDHAWYVEKGTVTQAPHAVFARAAESVTGKEVKG